MPRVSWAIPVVIWLASGCATIDRTSDKPGADRPKTLLRWASAKEQEKEKDNSKDKGSGKNNGEDNGNGDAKEKAPEKPQPDDIVTDRPTFTPASRTVGQGRVQLESGYTFSSDHVAGVSTFTHSYPEASLRIGMLADWLEIRIGQNFLSTVTPTRSDSGAADLLLGTKLWLTEKDRFLPETSLIVQTTVPSGTDAFTNRKMLPGLALIYSWDLIPDKVSLSGSSQANAAVDTTQHSYLQVAQSIVLGYALTKKLGVFNEWYALFPYGASTGVTPQYYFDSGFTYKLTSNFQLDVRAGLGLNRAATDFFTGAGFAYRY